MNRSNISGTGNPNDLFVDGKLAIDNIPFAQQVSSLERIVFRTGQYRGHVSREFADDGVPQATIAVILGKFSLF